MARAKSGNVGYAPTTKAVNLFEKDSFRHTATAETLKNDETHSFKEARELLIGHSKRNRLLFLVFVERATVLIRLISARPVLDQHEIA
ncbi:BrnT family toxin [Anaerolineae bacterium CFX7]|nr:BrnT family toxin [Anaerolineae bacterium CFX7]